MRNVVAAFALFSIALPAYAEREAWVAADTLNRRTCPSVKCGAVGVLKFREKVTVLEERNGWARITTYYDAACIDGASQYVDSGNKKCARDNGIENGRFAEWVSVRYLSAVQPADPAANASGNYALVKGSDDFRLHKDVFAQAASKLVASGRCSAEDFKNMGGWIKSSNHRSNPIYFTYCRGMRDRVYLNAVTGEVKP